MPRINKKSYSKLISRTRKPQETRDAPNFTGFPPVVMSQLLNGWNNSTHWNISPQTAIGVTAFKRCLDIISNNIASTKQLVYRQQPDGGKIAEPTHYLQRAIDCKGHILTNRWKHWNATCFQTAMHGSGFNEVVWKKKGVVDHLLLHDSLNVVVQEDNKGVAEYFLKKERRVVPIASMLHFSMPGMDGLNGISPLKAHSVTLMNAELSQTYYSALMQNSAVPRGILTKPTGGKFDDATLKNIRQFWDDVYSGPANQGKVGILNAGWEFKQLGMSPVDLAIIDMLRLSAEEISRCYGVPKSLLGLESTSDSNSSAEEHNEQFLSLTLVPWMEMIQCEVVHKLCVLPKDQDVFTEFRVEQLLRGDQEARGKYLDLKFRRGTLTRNEWITSDGGNPIGPEGNKYWIESNNISPIDDGEPAVESEPGEPQPDIGVDLYASIEPVLYEAVARLVKRGFNAFTSIRKNTDETTRDLRLAESRTNLKQFTAKALEPHLNLIRLLNKEITIDELAELVVNQVAEIEKESEIGDTTRTITLRALKDN